MLGRLAAMALAIAAFAPATATAAPRPAPPGHDGCHDCDRVTFAWMPGYDDPGTPNALDRVGVLKIGPAQARNVLVLNPGTSAGSAYFKPLADDIVAATNGRWQVWSVERRENQLEDHTALDQYKTRDASPQRLFDYYLGWLVDPSVTDHFELIPNSAVAFARGWGMNVEVRDLDRVVEAAGEHGRRVVMGGHSLGGTITTAYATWDFNGKAGARDLAGLVYIDGGSDPTPISGADASQAVEDLEAETPWRAFGGIPSPFTGIFSAAGSCGAFYDPSASNLGYTFPLLPANLKPPLPPGVVPTNEAQFGYALDTETSPPSLAAAQVHDGRLAVSGNPRGWVRGGEITSIRRYAAMLCGAGLSGVDGTAWYHPARLTLDGRSVANGNPNPAQQILDVRAIHGDDLRKRTQIYAFGAALGGERVLAAARLLAEQSGIPESELTLINREAPYSHNDPSAASPVNEFLENLIPFLSRIARPRDAAHRYGD
jgi:pimeloyl-ACP methyl ester carboxylesterase